jgi:hypothetical protein
VVTALAIRINLSTGQAVHTCVAGALLAGVVLLTSMASQYLEFAPLARAILAAAGGTVACLVVLRLASRWLLVPDLRQILLARSAASSFARRLCYLLGLKVIAI